MAKSRPTRFWNLTRHTISELYLAPAGTTDFGPNQCKNDKDGTVDPDERLRITGVASGTYDAKLKDVSGRSCLVRNIKVEAGEIFSIEEKEPPDLLPTRLPTITALGIRSPLPRNDGEVAPAPRWAISRGCAWLAAKSSASHAPMGY